MEEETEAMDEIHSKLPDHIIHDILRFLPRIKDLVRTSAISKTWLQAYRTFPILKFNLDDFVSRSSNLSCEETEAKRNQFIGFVENRLQWFARQNRGDGNGGYVMKRFELHTVSEMARLQATCWVGMALDCKIEQLSLNCCLELHDASLQLPCLIPDRVLSAYWLKSLELVGPRICIPLTESSRVDLPLLHRLTIILCDIMDVQLQKLLNGCPALEYIALSGCNSLYRVDIFHHPKLETLEVSARSAGANLAAIEVKAPMLKSFGYTVAHMDRSGLRRPDFVVKIHNSPELNSLTIRDGNKTDGWFHKFIAQFPLIKKLTIDGCIGLRKIRISNPLLEELSIINSIDLEDVNYFGVEDVVISSKKLTSFILFTQPFSILHSIRMKMDNCTAQIWLFNIDESCHLMMEASWYCKLKEFLTTHVTFKRLNICLNSFDALDGDMNETNVHKKLPPTACSIEELRLDVSEPSFCYTHILNGLLSACHPTTFVVMSAKPFVKSICKELGDRENKKKCCCKEGEFKCWKHQLKGVKIAKINGIKLEKDFDLDGLFDLLPTLKAGNYIYFKLTW